MTQQERTASREKLKRLIDELSDQELHAVGDMYALFISRKTPSRRLSHMFRWTMNRLPTRTSRLSMSQMRT